MSFTPTSNITLYARWTAVSTAQYTVSYDINGGSGTTPSSQTVNAGTSVTLNSGSGFSRSGFTFAGWNTNSSGSGTNYSAGSSYVVSGNVTLYARWTATVSGGESGTFVDGRDAKSYKWVKIGTQTWMAENLNYATSNSWCYDHDPSNCALYGRLYTWDAAMSACPSGWHLPTDQEWDVLLAAVGGTSTAGSKLKSATGWVAYSSITSTDEYGFSALPGGYGYWWSATEGGASDARGRGMYYDYDSVDSGWGDESNMFSLRCVRDSAAPQ